MSNCEECSATKHDFKKYGLLQHSLTNNKTAKFKSSKYSARKQSIFRLITAVVAILSMTFLTACGFTKAERSAKRELVVARTASVTSLNMWTQITANNAFAIDKLFDTLVTFNDKGEIVDQLAKSHSVSSDGLEYRFVLRDDLRFSNNTPLAPKDVVFSLRQHLDHKESPVPLSAPIESITVVNPHDISIRLTAPFAPLLAQLASFSSGIVPEYFGGKSEQEFFEKPVSSGPFVLQKWDRAGDVTFSVNKHYWSKKPSFEVLRYKLVESSVQAVNQLKTGRVDIIEEPEFDTLSSLSKDANLRVISGGSWKVEQLFFNTLNKYFSDIHVRRAFAMAVDKQSISKAVTFGFGKPITTIVPPTLAFHGNGDPGVKALPYGLEAAKAELAQSAYPQGFTAHVLIPSSNGTRVRIAQILQEAVKPLGIQLVVDQVDTATFRDKFRKYNFDIMINTAQADYPDADSMVDFEANPDGFSKAFWTHYRNDKVGELIAKARTAVTPELRSNLYTQIEQILVDESPYVPLYMSDNVKAVRAGVHGLELLPNGSMRCNGVDVK